MTDINIKRTLAATITIANKKVDCFKVQLADGSITAFLSTISLEKQFNINVEPQGNIRGVPVTDIQSFFDAVEESSAHQDLFNFLDETLNYKRRVHTIGGIEIQIIEYPDGQVFVELNEVKQHINITRDLELPILRAVCIGLDETVFVPLFNAIELLARRSKKPLKK